MNNNSKYMDMLIETGESNKILLPYILKTDKHIKSLSKKDLIYPKFRYYESKYNKNNSKYAYVSMVFNGDKYLPGILALGHSLRKVNTKHKLICCVQDKDEYGLDKITKEIIDEINKIYDLVIGVDIIKLESKSKYFFNQEKYYKYIKYYATKNNILGLIEYEKIIYLDASCIVNKSIDNLFELYDISTHKYRNGDNDFEYNLTNKMGLHANFLLIIPSIYIYNKFLILVKEYYENIGKYYLIYSPDELIFYYSLYPNINNNTEKMFNKNIVNMPYIKPILINKEINYNEFKNDCSVYLYERDKPFRPYPDLYTDLEIKTIINYKPFDEIVKSLIHERPDMLKYFEYIKTFRIVFF